MPFVSPAFHLVLCAQLMWLTNGHLTTSFAVYEQFVATNLDIPVTMILPAEQEYSFDAELGN